jgi:death-on-curing protein
VREPAWLSTEVALALHDRLLSDFGGPPGLRDRGLLDSAMARPKQLYAYSDPSMPQLAAAYAAGILRNHPFVDGNKRLGFLLAYVFLARNGYDLKAREAEAAQAVLDLASGLLSEEVFARWLADHSDPSENEARTLRDHRGS